MLPTEAGRPLFVSQSLCYLIQEGNCRLGQNKTRHPYWRPLRYVCSEPSLIGSLMMMSPLRILMLYRQDGLVHTHALYSMEAPWLPKSESGTRSPSLHLRHRGNAFSTKSPPSFSLEGLFAGPQKASSEKVSRGGASAAASASPQQV